MQIAAEVPLPCRGRLGRNADDVHLRALVSEVVIAYPDAMSKPVTKNRAQMVRPEGVPYCRCRQKCCGTRLCRSVTVKPAAAAVCVAHQASSLQLADGWDTFLSPRSKMSLIRNGPPQETVAHLNRQLAMQATVLFDSPCTNKVLLANVGTGIIFSFFAQIPRKEAWFLQSR